jgi:uncharacterized protein YpuA (DUF1002 family)
VCKIQSTFDYRKAFSLSIDEQIASLKKRIEAARLAKARADVGREAADKQHAEAMAELRDSFGVDNQAQVRAKLAQLQDDVASKLEQITQILNAHKL